MRVRFAPSPTGYLHNGSARTFIFNRLYARHHGGTTILRIDDTDLERNTSGLKWLGLDWDKQYHQSDRLDLHREMANAIFETGNAYRDFTPAHAGEEDKGNSDGPWLFNAGMREVSAGESGRRAAAGEPFVLRFRVPREAGPRPGSSLKHLLDFPTRGRELLHELGQRLSLLEEFTEANMEAELRKLAIERQVKAALIINAARAALSGQTVGPSVFHVFTAVGRQRVPHRLRNA